MQKIIKTNIIAILIFYIVSNLFTLIEKQMNESIAEGIYILLGFIWFDAVVYFNRNAFGEIPQKWLRILARIALIAAVVIINWALVFYCSF
ncbi:MAG: hypothetical protein V1779_09510 [bacterium]